MSKGRFLNQKLGKRTDRKSQLLKAQLKTQRLPKRAKAKDRSAHSKRSSH